MQHTKVKDIMTPHPIFVSPNATLERAAFKMKDFDCDILPVGTRGDVQGIITNLVIVLRAIAGGKDISKESVKSYMNQEVYSCQEDDVYAEAIEKMQFHNVSHLIVKNAKGDMSGIVSFGSILKNTDDVSKISTMVKRDVVFAN